MKLNLKIWRQDNHEAKGSFVSYAVDNIPVDMSFLEMLDLLNEQLIQKGERVIEFDHARGQQQLNPPYPQARSSRNPGPPYNAG